jgi:hypothetical protein
METHLEGLIGIISIGVCGNLASIGVFLRKSFAKRNIKNMLIISLLTDSIALILVILLINSNWVKPSTVFCKIYQSLTMMIPAYSSWILVYISIERYISIVHSRKKIAKIFGNKWFQLMSLLGAFIVTVFYYYTQWLDFNVVYIAFINSTMIYYDSMTSETQPYCAISDQSNQIASLMDAIYSCVAPFIALITSSILIIYSLKQARLRLRTSQNSEAAHRREQKDFEFAKTILFLDIIFFLFHFPYSFFILVISFYSFDLTYGGTGQIILNTFIYLSYIGYAINFLIFLTFNKDFRAEFLSLFKFKNQNRITPHRS